MNATKQTIEKDWEQVLVRHVVETKRRDVSRISSLLQTPFPSRESSSCDGGSRDVSILGYPAGRWMIAARFARESWVALFSNAATGEELFEANAASRRLEVAWIGCKPGQAGWFFRLNRAGKPIVEFAQAVNDDAPSTFNAVDIEAGLLNDCQSGQQAVGRLCAEFGISLPIRQIRATQREYQIIGARGKPVKRGLRGYVHISGPEIAEGEDEAASALADAIERCDPDAIRKAIQRGASLIALPDTSVSPLMKALFRCAEPNGKECVATLVGLGCPIDGNPNDDPTVIDCAAHFVDEGLALEMLKTIVPLGADVNAVGPRTGNTALHNVVVHRRAELARYLLAHGADPTIKNRQGLSPIDWLRSRLEKESRFSRRAEYAELLSLLTGEPVQEPEVPALSEALQAENDRFRLCHKARLVLDMIPQEVELNRIKASRLARIEPYGDWTEQLLDAGFELAGHYVQKTIGRVFLSVYTNPQLSFDAILSSGGPLGAQLRCEIASYHPDDTVTVVASLQSPDDPDFAPPSIVRKEYSGASPAQLVEKMRDLVGQKELVAIDAGSFEERYAKALRRLSGEIRDRAARVLDTPSILVDGSPARYERLGFYLDLSGWDDPTYSSQRIAESALADLGRLSLDEEPGDPFDVEMAIQAAMELVAMRHFQFAGAPDSLDFVVQGSDLALAYFQALGGRWRRQVRTSQITELTEGLLLAGLAGRWDTFEQICNAVTPRLASADTRDAGDPPIEYAQVFLVFASHYRRRALPKIAGLEQAIQKGRPRRPRWLLEVWRAIRAGHQAEFDEALRGSLEYFTERREARSAPNDMIDFLPIAESVFNLAAMERGLKLPRLPQRLADLLITPDSVGMPS